MTGHSQMLHSFVLSEDPENENYQTLAARLWPQYLVQDREKEDAFPLYFEDMMTGHWAGSYYSHTWSKMLAADIFSAYTEAGLDNPQVEENLLECWQCGSTRSAFQRIQRT